MKGFLSLFMCLVLIPGAVCAAGYDKNMYGDLNLRYNNTVVKQDTGAAYVGLRGDLSLLSWKNKYTNEAGVQLGSDSFTLKPVIGFDVFVGYKFDKNWRGDLEFGYVGKYSDHETEHYNDPERTDFSLETSYLAMNGYYDFKYGLYAGAGVGIALVESSVYSNIVAGVNETKISPLGAIMFGWTYKLDEKIDLDLRYRLSVFDAGHLTLSTGGSTWVKAETGIVTDNSLSVGVRYSF